MVNFLDELKVISLRFFAVSMSNYHIYSRFLVSPKNSSIKSSLNLSSLCTPQVNLCFLYIFKLSIWFAHVFFHSKPETPHKGLKNFTWDRLSKIIGPQTVFLYQLKWNIFLKSYPLHWAWQLVESPLGKQN